MLEMGGLLVVVGVIMGTAAPYLIVSGEAQERLKHISRGLPYVIDLMALSMGAGLDFPGAVRQVVEKSSNPEDPIVEEFTLILQTLSLGRTRKDALTEFARRAPAAAATEFVNALVQAEERGNPVAEVLSIQATSSRTRRSVRAEELASKAGVKMAGPLMLVFFAVLGLLIGPAMMSIMSEM
jgi:tight adherence protein C